jgi:hypothetical protein
MQMLDPKHLFIFLIGFAIVTYEGFLPLQKLAQNVELIEYVFLFSIWC